MDISEESSDQEHDVDRSSQRWLFDAFSEPRTMPSGWDLSGMNGSRGAEVSSGPAEPVADSIGHEEVGAGLHIFYLNPFPEPRTYPVHWDLCR